MYYDMSRYSLFGLHDLGAAAASCAAANSALRGGGGSGQL